MQITVIHDDFGTRSQHEMKSIAEDYVGPGIANLLRTQTFDTAIGTDRHKGWRSYFAPRKLHGAGSGLAIGGIYLKLHMTVGHD